MVKPSDPFAIKEWGGDIADRDVSGWSWRVFEGTSLGEPGVGSLKRVISQQAVWLLMLILGLGIFLLIGRVWWLQGVQGGYWRGVAEGNRRPQEGPLGRIALDQRAQDRQLDPLL